MAKIDGIVSEAGTLRSKKRLLVTNEDTGQVEEHLIPHGKHVLVQHGDFVHKGQLITEGAKDPHEILEILGPSAVQEYLIEEIQKVYRLQGVTINDKHLEVIISRMLFKVRVTDPGDTEFFWETKLIALLSSMQMNQFPKREESLQRQNQSYLVLPRPLLKLTVLFLLRRFRKPPVF